MKWGPPLGLGRAVLLLGSWWLSFSSAWATEVGEAGAISRQSASEPGTRHEGEGDSSQPEETIQAWGNWTAPPECIPETELLGRVEDSFVDHQVPKNRIIQGEAERVDGGTLVRFSVTERGRAVGQRVLELPSGDCREHDETLVLVFALLLEHGPSEDEREEALATPVPEVPPSEAPILSPSPVSNQDKASSAPTSGRDRFGMDLSVGYLLARGWTRASAGGIEGQVSIRMPSEWGLGLAGAYLAPRTGPVDFGRLKSSGGYLGVSLCWRPLGRRFVFLGCGVGGALFLAARGVGLDRSEHVHFETGFVGLRVEGRARLSEHFFFYLAGQGAGTVRPVELVVLREDDAEIVYKSAPLWGGFAVGAGLTY